jgi:hypothetical protein
MLLKEAFDRWNEVLIILNLDSQSFGIAPYLACVSVPTTITDVVFQLWMYAAFDLTSA